MLWIISIAAGIGGALTVLLALSLRRLVSPGRIELVDPEWLNRFSVAKYRPMSRLFSDEDYRYLSKQTGYRPEIGHRLRRERIAVFQGYLRCISADFRRLEAAVSFWMANAPGDMPDAAKALLKTRLQFFMALTGAHWRVQFYRFGLGTMDGHQLVDSLDDMRVCLRQMALARSVA
jgi:hypothetical protein